MSSECNLISLETKLVHNDCWALHTIEFQIWFFSSMSEKLVIGYHKKISEYLDNFIRSLWCSPLSMNVCVNVLWLENRVHIVKCTCSNFLIECDYLLSYFIRWFRDAIQVNWCDSEHRIYEHQIYTCAN